MLLTEQLKKEFTLPAAGGWAQPYFKALGLSECPDAPIPVSRANGVRTELTAPTPYLYPSDRIAGCQRPLFADIPEEKRAWAQEIVNRFGERGFWQNADHFAPDYFMIVKEGIPGMLAMLDASAASHAGEAERVQFLSEMKAAFSALASMIEGYAALAESLAGTPGYDAGRLGEISRNCRALLARAPQSFAEGLQLVWFCHLAFCYEGRYAMALGRIDQYLYPLFRHDTDMGILTEDEATELLENVFAKIYERHVLTGGDDVVNICIGGTNLDESCAVNRLSYCVLRAVGNCNVPGPNLSARITPHTPDDFLDLCLQTIGTGLGYPALMNDTVNLAALGRYGYEKEDLYNYCMVGCIENFITGKQPPWSDGRYDTPRFFEYLFNEGKGIFSDTRGVDTGKVSDIASMEDFMRKFEIQLAKGAEEYANGFINGSRVARPEDFTSPFLSCFCRECIERGMDINNGGAKYPSVHGAVLMGVGTVCDSLAAIEKNVFIDHTTTLEEIREALLCNFEGKEALRRLMLSAPKYGNNDPFVDKYAVWFVDYLASCFDKYRTYDGGYFYIAMAANTSNIWAGKGIAATPDGRLAGEPLSDAASPTYGRDTSGSTCTICSVSKPDYKKVACGTVVNQKYMPAMFRDGNREKLAALIRVYFKRGGQEIQINATSPEILRDAMANPEKYENLVVRVSGFSAFYVTLGEDVQKDILHRTQQTVS